MARRAKFRDEDLLNAAREVFLAHGMSATTADVAERAGVAEGTLFHRFKSKQALFREALRPGLQEPAGVTRLLESAGKRPIADALVEAGLAIIDSLREQIPALMLVWSNPGPEGICGLIAELEPPGKQMVRTLARYFEAEIRLGRLRRVDSEIAARGLVGSIFDYAMEEIMHGAPAGLPLPPAMFVRGLVDIFLHGIFAQPAVKIRRRSRR